ncbi:hypothetical protein [Roseateles sp.]|uniref:hypothetical protein n=1 Tax=Roseateles sp. TaxID=1971397 RepID=UPI0031D7E790
MPNTWDAPPIDTSLPSAIGQASDESRAVLAACIRTAKNQRCFYDADRQSPEHFRASLAYYNRARYELFSTFQWLMEMLPDEGPDAPVRRDIKQRAGDFTRLPMGMTAQSARLFGDGKRDLLALPQWQREGDVERCLRVVRSEAAHRANESQAWLSEREREEAIDSEVQVALNRLGIACSVGGSFKPRPSGLIDLSTDGLVALLLKIEADEQIGIQRAG